MTAEVTLAELRADALQRAPDPPAFDSVIEEAGCQRLAAYYLYSARMAGLIGDGDLPSGRWPPELRGPMERLGLARLAPRTWRGLDAELTSSEQEMRRTGRKLPEFADDWEAVAQQLAAAPHGDDPLAGLASGRSTASRTARWLKEEGISHSVSAGVTLAVSLHPVGAAVGMGTHLVRSRIQTDRDEADALRRLGQVLRSLRDGADAELRASPGSGQDTERR